MIATAPTAAELRARKGARRLAMLTAYDYPTALALDARGSTSCWWATAWARWSSATAAPARSPWR